MILLENGKKTALEEGAIDLTKSCNRWQKPHSLYDSSWNEKTLNEVTYVYADAPALGDRYITTFYARGNENKLYIGMLTGPDCGIIDVYIEGIPGPIWSNEDLYNAANLVYYLWVNFGFTLEQGYNRILLNVKNKNPLSSGYQLQVFGLSISSSTLES